MARRKGYFYQSHCFSINPRFYKENFMIDPFTAFSVATAAFNGIKKVVEVGREVQDVYSQLSQWAGAISDLQESISQIENKKPGLFEKIGFQKSETKEAFDTFIAKQKIVEMEKEIHHMFTYGALQHLGSDGYKEFIQMRRNIKTKREKMIYEQMRAKIKFVNTVKDLILSSFILIPSLYIIYIIVKLIYDAGVTSGRW
jgi:DNA-binding FrmR family transcriptional regulator